MTIISIVGIPNSKVLIPLLLGMRYLEFENETVLLVKPESDWSDRPSDFPTRSDQGLTTSLVSYSDMVKKVMTYLNQCG